MQKTFYLRTICCYIALLFAFTGCDSEEATGSISSIKLEVPQVENGRLVFKSKQQILDLARHINSSTTSKQAMPSDTKFVLDLPYNHNIKGFKSLLSTIKGKQENGEYHELSEMSMSSFNASILNDKGEIQVADSVYFVKKGAVEVVPVKSLNSLNKTGNSNSYTIAKQVSGTGSCFTTYSGRYRVRGNSFINFYGYLAEAGIKTTWEEKYIFGWRGSWDGIEDAKYPGQERLGFTFTSSFSSPYNWNGNASPYTVTSRNWYLTSPSLEYYVIPTHYSGTRISGQILTNHFVKLKNGDTVSCNSQQVEWWY